MHAAALKEVLFAARDVPLGRHRAMRAFAFPNVLRERNRRGFGDLGIFVGHGWWTPKNCAMPQATPQVIRTKSTAETTA
jgi:hypothetical protein